jgi:hypothetical protein
MFEGLHRKTEEDEKKDVFRWQKGGRMILQHIIKILCVYGGEKRCVQGFDGETCGMETTWKA